MQKRITGNRIIALLLATFLLVAYMPLLGSEVYASDNSTSYLELYTTQDATVQTDKFSRDNLAIYIKANCAEDGEYWPWIGIYEGALTTDSWNSSIPSLVWAYSDTGYGTQAYAFNGDQAVDICQNYQEYSSSHSYTRFVIGKTYTAILFKSYDDYGPVVAKQFTITGDASTFTTDKERYKAGEAINVSTTTLYPDAWVGLYEFWKGQEEGVNVNLEDDLLQWYRVSEQTNPFDITTIASDDLETGKKYKVILFYSKYDFDESTKYIRGFTVEHYYADPTWSWNDDYSEATATFKCVDDASEEDKTIKVSGDGITSSVANADCANPEITTYTATISSVSFLTESDKTSFTDSQEVETAAINSEAHSYGSPTYEWAEDHSTCTAKRVCENDTTHVDTETATAKCEETPATCAVAGKKVYTAAFENTAFETQTTEETIAIDPKAHKNLIKVPGKEPTTTEAGVKEHSKCEDCGKFFDADGKEITEAETVIDKLPDEPKPDDSTAKAREELASFIAEAEDLLEKAVENAKGKYTEDSQKALQAAIEKAKEAVKTGNNLDEATKQLKDAIAGLKPAEQTEDGSVKKGLLEKAIEEAEKAVENAKGKYTEESQKALQTAIEKAKEAVKTGNNLDEATKQLKDAIAGLKPAQTEEEKAAAEAKDALNKTVEDAKKIQQGNYTDESFKALQDAIAEAETLAKDEKATKAQLDAAAAKINDAKANLKEKPTGPAVGTKVVIGGNTYTVATAPDAATKEVTFTKAKNKKKVTVPDTVKIGEEVYKVTAVGAKAFTGKKIRSATIGKNVKKINSNAFKSSKATTMIVKTKLLKKASVKGSLKGSKIKTVNVKVGSKKTNSKYVKKYKKIFTKKNAGKKVTVK